MPERSPLPRRRSRRSCVVPPPPPPPRPGPGLRGSAHRKKKRYGEQSTKTKWLGFSARDLPRLLLPSALAKSAAARTGGTYTRPPSMRPRLGVGGWRSPLPCAAGAVSAGRAQASLPAAPRGSAPRLSSGASAPLGRERRRRAAVGGGGARRGAGHWQGSPARSPCTATCLGPLGLIYVVRSGGRQWLAAEAGSHRPPQ